MLGRVGQDLTQIELTRIEQGCFEREELLGG